MVHTLRTAFRRWADSSTGLGMTARRVRRQVHHLANASHRDGNIAMLHAGRCGSSVLADLLNQHPDVRWAGELFENMQPAYYNMASGSRARERIANAMYRHRCRFFGFDSKYLPEQHLRPELANMSPAEYVDLLRELGFDHFILLNRRNHLRRAVSVAVGTQTGQWNTSGAITTTERLRLDPERFVSYGTEMPLLQYFRSLDEVHTELEDLLTPCHTLHLVYEEDIQADPTKAYRRTCEFLGLPTLRTDVRLKKINPKPLSELVENLDEIASVLDRTPYRWMLDE